MAEDIKVSVIVPVYNVKKYLARCLDSIIVQTLKDIEIICVNDGSTDGSDKILEEYAKKDSRIQIVTRKNGGLSAATAGLTCGWLRPCYPRRAWSGYPLWNRDIRRYSSTIIPRIPRYLIILTSQRNLRGLTPAS